MNQQQAAALVMYLSRCVGIVPTTGGEWTLLEPALKIIEAVASGRMTLNPEQTKPREVQSETG